MRIISNVTSKQYTNTVFRLFGRYFNAIEKYYLGSFVEHQKLYRMVYNSILVKKEICKKIEKRLKIIFVYSKRSVEYTIESVSVAGRPAVYTIISERRLRST